MYIWNGLSKTGPFNFQMFLPKFQMVFHKIAAIFQISNGQALGLQVPFKFWTNANQFLFDGSKSGSVRISDLNCIALSTCQVALSFWIKNSFFLSIQNCDVLCAAYSNNNFKIHILSFITEGPKTVSFWKRDEVYKIRHPPPNWGFCFPK